MTTRDQEHGAPQGKADRREHFPCLRARRGRGSRGLAPWWGWFGGAKPLAIGVGGYGVRIKTKWMSCGHGDRALLVLYVQADGKRQGAGSLCKRCALEWEPEEIKRWAEMTTGMAYTYRASDLRGVGDVRIIFARVVGAEDAIPDALLEELPVYLEGRKVQLAQEFVDIGRDAGLNPSDSEEVARGITFAVEAGASPADYQRWARRPRNVSRRASSSDTA